MCNLYKYRQNPLVFSKKGYIMPLSYKRRAIMTQNKDMVKIFTSNILLQIGIPGNVAGSKYLLRAVEIAINNPNSVMAVTKCIYPIIAMEFSTRATNIERAIRHAIEISWNKNKIVHLNQLFGIDIYSKKEKPTNSEFIALLAERIPFLSSAK